MVRWSNPGGGEIFRAHPNRPWSSPSLLYDRYRVISGVQRQGSGIDHPTHLAPELKKEYSYISTPNPHAFILCSTVNFSFI